MNVFKRSLLAAAAVILAAVQALLLFSCGKTPNGPVPETAENTESSEPETEAIDTLPLTGDPVSIGYSELGLTPFYIVSENKGVVSFLKDPDALILTPTAPGSTVITVKNVYAEEAAVRVEVSSSLSITYELDPFVKGRFLDASAEGAKKNTDVTSVLQKCIDTMHAEGGGTVYLPAGNYKLGSITMRPGVTLRLAGFPRKATDGYIGQTSRDAASGVYAAITTTGGSRNNIFIYNVDLPQSYCTSGYSDFRVSGGLWDCQSKMKWSATACGSNIVFENAVIKDIPNNHAMQIDACSDFTVRNVAFAGYYYPTDGVLTRETIQLEPTTPGAITGDHANSPILCDNGDYHSCKNVSVIGCYFGKSDKTGPQLVAVGHHSAGGSLVCDGFRFEGNKVDNPLYCGLHLPNYVNVVIRDNEFISNTPSSTTKLGDDSALLSLYGFSGNNTFTIDGKTVYHAYGYEHPGTQNFVITGNVFKLGGKTPLRAVYICGVSNDNRNYAVYTVNSSQYRVEQYPGPLFSLKGFVLHRNIAANITFSGNEISVTSQPGYVTDIVYLRNILGFFCDGNEVNYADGVSMRNSAYGIRGFYVYSGSVVTDPDVMNRRSVTVEPGAAAKFCVSTPEGEMKFAGCKAACTLTFERSGNGTLSFTTDKKGNLTLHVLPDPGWKYAGLFDSDGNPVDIEKAISVNKTIYAKFVKE